METSNTRTSSTAVVTKAIRRYFRVHGITHAEAARRLGKSKQTVSNRLSSLAEFTPMAAALWGETFGFSEVFLLTGKGSLVDEKPSDEVVRLQAENDSLRARIRELEGALSCILTFTRQ